MTIAAVLLIQFGASPWLENNPEIYFGIGVTLLFALFQTTQDQHAELDETLSTTAGELVAIRHDLRDDGALLKMEAAILELESLLRKADGREEIVIEHFGLDMTFAWKQVDDLIKIFRHVARLEYNVLILADRSPDPGHPRDVQKWMQDGHRQMDHIRRRRDELAILVADAGGQLVLQLHPYADRPMVHGIRLRRPFELAYVSICRWGEAGEYDWGGNEYHRIHPASCSAAHRDVLAVFDRNFQYYWNQRREPSEA